MTPTPGSWLDRVSRGSQEPLPATSAPQPVSPPTPAPKALTGNSGGPRVVSPSLSVPQAAVELVCASEGFRSQVYPDPGTGGAPWTIGYGSTRDLDGKPFGPGTQSITQDAAKALLSRDLQAAAVSVAKCVHVALSEPCRAALISFAYNLGEPNFAKSAMLRLINAGKLKDAADEFPKWNLAGGKVLKGLVIRRAAERKVFLSGVPA